MSAIECRYSLSLSLNGGALLHVCGHVPMLSVKASLLPVKVWSWMPYVSTGPPFTSVPWISTDSLWFSWKEANIFRLLTVHLSSFHWISAAVGFKEMRADGKREISRRRKIAWWMRISMRRSRNLSHRPMGNGRRIFLFSFLFFFEKVFCRKFRVSRRRKSRDYETVMPLEHKMRGIFTFCLVRARPFLFLGVTLCKQRNQCWS